MSQEAVPEQEAAQDPSVPAPQGAPKGLLQQMEELMAALNADLTQLDADLQQSASTAPQPPGSGEPWQLTSAEPQAPTPAGQRPPA
ncbi:hypothetical protein DMA15_28520 [Streptomyces sp. WAC 01529]|uniref:hypothetical protein n=1 Tax=Streptomyces sp. WAC 01529 TaxID=2203205 RepID=UPI000F71C97D|nr:hypothetical protein [Streptomyces sp. WAC 01529]AZM56052.1 hypothetical protein DMA15_28520 [Streptomyces sp. WAC 01529]